jgi:hypothetical protein
MTGPEKQVQRHVHGLVNGAGHSVIAKLGRLRDKSPPFAVWRGPTTA